MTEHPTEHPVTDQRWKCLNCGYARNPASATSCESCGLERAPAPLKQKEQVPTELVREGQLPSEQLPTEQVPTEQVPEGHDPPATGGVHGWRLMLPDFSVVPLATGTHKIGRGSTLPGIARVLGFFPDVSRVQLELDVTSQTLEVHVPRRSHTSVFRVNGDKFSPIKTQMMGMGDAWTLCLGQSCFVRIDRGVA